MWSKFQLILNTVKHLKWIQVRYQVFYRLRGKLGLKPKLKNYVSRPKDQIHIGDLKAALFDELINYKRNEIEFEFLNLTKQFDRNKIDWN